MGLLLVFSISTFLPNIGCYITATRMLWTLGRDNATPWSMRIGKVNMRWKNPFNAILVNACATSILGVIYVGSMTAFSAIIVRLIPCSKFYLTFINGANRFQGVFMIFLQLSYTAAILPHFLSRRRYVKPGKFWMSPPVAYSVMGIACTYMIVSSIIFCFPFSLPVSAPTMVSLTN